MQQIGLGLQRDRQGDWQARLNGEVVQRIADCASVLPVQLVQPESFRLFFGGPKERRQFFDLGLFHVEPSFYSTWLHFHKVLKQRNALLKSRLGYNEQYAFWDQQFVELSLLLNEMRVRYLAMLRQAVLELTNDVPFLQGLQLSLATGWPETGAEQMLASLHHYFASDLKFGYTQLGPQKADLRLKVNGEDVDEVLSRGQLKVLLFALKIAQSNVIFSSGFKQPLLLIDDLASELDEDSKRYIFEFLKKTQSQVFITAIEESQILPQLAQQSEVGVFHVEHGQIKRTDNDGRR
jgi:DNA replication and repair protein RecF